jgi:hypothetical protein
VPERTIVRDAKRRQYHPPQRHTRAGVELPRHTDGRTLSARRFKKLVVRYPRPTRHSFVRRRR